MMIREPRMSTRSGQPFCEAGVLTSNGLGETAVTIGQLMTAALHSSNRVGQPLHV